MSTPPADVAPAVADALAISHHWYHSIELAPGVVTPGQVDLRRTARRILPADLTGRRALDVGTFDGFWAFELERRGAETVAIDVPALEDAEWPPTMRPALERRAREWDLEVGRGFRAAAAALGSRVRRVECNVYDLAADVVGGPVDFMFVGSLLLHLRNPMLALERMRDTLTPGGTLLLLEPFSWPETLLAPRRPVAYFKPLRSEFTWWYANISTLKAWTWAAGLQGARIRGLHRPPAPNRQMRGTYVALRCRRPA